MPADAPIARTPQWTLYEQAVVDIELPEQTIRVTPAPLEVPDGPFPAPRAETIHIVTAYNPAGRPASVQDNHRAQRLDRRAFRWWPAAGGDMDGLHMEESPAVIGLSDREARALGHRFGQDAVFAWSPTTWRLLACLSTAEAPVRGWRATPQLRRRSSRNCPVRQPLMRQLHRSTGTSLSGARTELRTHEDLRPHALGRSGSETQARLDDDI
jgi:hypothetical protein